MRRFAAVVLAGSLLATNAFAASDAALAPGKPAGVQKATATGNGFLIFAGIAIVAGGIALVASEGNSGNNIAVNTSSTSTSSTSSTSTTTTSP